MKQKLFLPSLPENRKKAAQTEKDNMLRSKSARSRVAQGQERDRVKELSYDYVSDEEDSTDGKWVVRKPSWRSQEADRIS